MKIKFPFFFLAALIVLPAPAQLRLQRRYALTNGQVAKAVIEAFVQHDVIITTAQVSLLSSIAATEPDPALDVQSIEPLAASATSARSTVKISCHKFNACLPFYALVTWPLGAPQNTVTSLKSHAFTIHNADPVIMRSGARATLAIDDATTHLRISVVSLERGSIGQHIHVASPDHKQKYLAEVVSSDLLKGSL